MKVKFDDGMTRKTVSRWIKRKLEVVTERHSLADYAHFEQAGSEDEKRLWLDYFKHDGDLYALGQFERCYPIMDVEDKGIIISGYDSTVWYKPYCLEISDCGEYVRLWEEVETKDD